MSEHTKVGPYSKEILLALLPVKGSSKTLNKLLSFLILLIYCVSFLLFLGDSQLDIFTYVAIILPIVATIVWLPFFIAPRKCPEYGIFVLGTTFLILSISCLVLIMNLAMQKIMVLSWSYIAIIISIYVVICIISIYGWYRLFRMTPTQLNNKTPQYLQVKFSVKILMVSIVIGVIHQFFLYELAPHEKFGKMSTMFFGSLGIAPISIMIMYMYYIMRTYPEMRFENRESLTKK